jgi:hypothetical protein
MKLKLKPDVERDLGKERARLVWEALEWICRLPSTPAVWLNRCRLVNGLCERPEARKLEEP